MAGKHYQYLMGGPASCEVVLDSELYLYFAGTSYFQLHSDPRLKKAAIRATGDYGIGTATTRGMTGTTSLIRELEKKLAAFFKHEDAIYLPSGYLSSLAGLKAIRDIRNYDLIFIDEFAHYSLYDAARATGCKLIPFKHRDVDDLGTKMEEYLKKGGSPLIASDGMFPISGALAPIPGYLELCSNYNGYLWIDDAHAVGILGSNGRGSCEVFGIESDRLYFGATLSKAFGAYGGFICGSEDFIGHVASGPVLTGSSAPMSAAVAAALRGLEVLEAEPELRQKLWDNANYMKGLLEALNLPLEENLLPDYQGTSPVISFTTGDSSRMLKIRNDLMSKGVFIQHTTYRGAGKEGMLRLVISSEHSREQMDRLESALREAL